MNKSSDHNIKAAHVSWQLNELIKSKRARKGSSCEPNDIAF